MYILYVVPHFKIHAHTHTHTTLQPLSSHHRIQTHCETLHLNWQSRHPSIECTLAVCVPILLCHLRPVAYLRSRSAGSALSRGGGGTLQTWICTDLDLHSGLWGLELHLNRVPPNRVHSNRRAGGGTLFSSLVWWHDTLPDCSVYVSDSSASRVREEKERERARETQKEKAENEGVS